MKTCMIVSAFVLALALGLSPRAQAQDAPKEHSMTGCLQKTDAGFKLTDLEKGPKEVIIAESTADLAPHAGHKMEITGTAIPGKQPHTMKVTSIKMIAKACP
jgi:hypothetical protein